MRFFKCFGASFEHCFAFATKRYSIQSFLVLVKTMSSQFKVADVGTRHKKTLRLVNGLVKRFNVVNCYRKLFGISGKQSKFVKNYLAENDMIFASCKKCL